MESATRGSRRTLRGFTLPSAVFTRIRSLLRSTHTGETCGEPSRITVAMWAKFVSSNSFLTPGDNVTVMGASFTATSLAAALAKGEKRAFAANVQVWIKRALNLYH